MNINKIRHKLICASVLSLAFSGSAFAGTESGIYLGLGYGDASVEATGYDENGSSYKAFVGYNFGVIPLVDLAIEASYVDFGSTASNNARTEITGLNAFGLAGLSFGPFGIFAKAGYMNWDISGSFSDSGSDPAYGVGARLALGSFLIRAEYELYDFSNVDVEMLSVSGVYTF